jgi:hypothetical protein
MKIGADLPDGQINMRKSRQAGDAQDPTGRKTARSEKPDL